MVFTPRNSVWTEVQSLMRQGYAPVIELTEGQRVHVPKPEKPKAGRRPLTHPFANYRMLTQNGRPMTCRNPGCNKVLGRRTECITCGPACRDELLHRCKQIAGILEGSISPDELDLYYRGINARTRTRQPDSPRPHHTFVIQPSRAA